METLVESFVLRLAAFSIALGVVLRFVVRPAVRWVRGVWLGSKALRSDMAKVRKIIEAEWTPNGGASSKDQLNQLTKGQHDLAALLTEHMAVEELEHVDLLRQLRDHGIEIVELPSKREQR